MTNRILILSDYRGQFWLKSNYKEESVDLLLLKKEFSKLGYDVFLHNFAEIDFKHENYSGWYVFYQSSEDPNLLYKSYIEDILLGLKLQGAILVPGFEYFRAHHNKVFMEILRELHGNDQMKRLQAWYYGTYEDYLNDKRIDYDKKHVFKLSSGAQSKNVRLIGTSKEHSLIPKAESRSVDWYYWVVDQIKPYWKKRYPNYRKKSHNRKKFIIQEYISDLDCDYKVLILSDKVFVLTRNIRPNDFRASGSGRFSFSKNVPDALFDYSYEVFSCFDTPFISLDVAIKEGITYLIEFQFVNYGTYTAEKAKHYFKKENEKWICIEKNICIEHEYANSIDVYIKNQNRLDHVFQ